MGTHRDTVTDDVLLPLTKDKRVLLVLEARQRAPRVVEPGSLAADGARERRAVVPPPGLLLVEQGTVEAVLSRVPVGEEGRGELTC